ncbi:hypothetical protein HCEG_04554 [Histoplasma capsulatum var. duboisii H88]|uniref:Uncharacterized protein n=2 Tax=Ajellomyces capsulatus TaxID=5037 RepID=F0UDX8_AJEC8|nr:hypothetical protein HCDG_06270 [Histoplasma capsulatum H143]EGC45339.1 hypothetical protein HCEG_04554 [Histoplasma capsulatum var. duboisii H88]
MPMPPPPWTFQPVQTDFISAQNRERLFEICFIHDSSLIYILGMLRAVRGYFQTDAARKRQCRGFLSNIDEAYAIEELSLDMKLLFRPLQQYCEGYRRAMRMNPSYDYLL